MADRKTAFAVAAHPDDIEFMMSGTLVLLKQAGFEIHYMNVANGNCGTATMTSEEAIATREVEARAAAASIGAVWHPSLTNDLEILYSSDTLHRMCAVVREVNPSIMLVPSNADYMEDHMNAARVAVTAAFCRGMRNFPTVPPTAPVEGEVTIYHALPYGLRDGMRRKVFPELYVDVTAVMDAKRKMLASHRSQKEWLDVSQGLDAYINVMAEMCDEVGLMSGRFAYAEGWRRHSHLGFAKAESDPLTEALGSRASIDERYERSLDMPPWEE